MSKLLERLQREVGRIKDVLREHNSISTKEISARANMDYYKTLIALEALEELKEVKRTLDRGTRWTLVK